MLVVYFGGGAEVAGMSVAKRVMGVCFGGGGGAVGMVVSVEKRVMRVFREGAGVGVMSVAK